LTLAGRKTQIPPNELSATFRDAIDLTRRLGFQYIWIDSLCIIQDSRADWAVESAKMAIIYANSALTIAATSSASGTGGLYRATPDYEVSGKTLDGEAFKLFFRRRIEHSLAHDPDMDAQLPLLSRAWVFQERMLSPRVLHFGPQELFFECRSDCTCECGEILGLEIPLPAPKLSHWQVFISNNNNADAYYCARAWRGMVAQYSTLRLKYGSDRLPAFGGLARQVSQMRRSKYLAGLWEDSIIDDLCWIAGPRKQRPKWRAPTWSWAAVSNPIYYNDAPLFWDTRDIIAEQPNEAFFTKLVDSKCTPAYTDEYGELKDGFLKLEGPFLDGTLFHGDEADVSSVHRFPKRRKTKLRYIVCLQNSHAFEFTPDYAFEEQGPGHIPSGAPIRCLILKESRQDGKGKFVALILTPSSSAEEVFERIGVLFTTERLISVPLEGCSVKRQEICIV
jgi:Heterokaryon incompatibility protein (HET)